MKPQKRVETSNTSGQIKRVFVWTLALTLVMQNFAWAVCTDGSNLPAGGYVIGVPPVQQASNWSPHVFTGTTGSLWVPDTSVNEHNDPAKPLTGGGHNWVFDQGSTLCKVTDTGPAGKVATGWDIPPNNPTDCVVLPVIKGGRVTNLGDIPYQGDVITPTCDPRLLSTDTVPNPSNTYFNQLGCSISHGIANTPATATSFLFVAGIKGGLFSIPLENVGSPPVGGTAGKTVGPQNYYSQIPEATLLTNAAVSKDGQFAMVTSLRRDLRVWACLNPLGDPGDPSLPINPDFFSPPASTVSCMQVGSNNLAVTLTNAFGPDNQPYFGGRRVVNSFDSVPGGNFTSSWPNCIWQPVGAASLSDAFVNGFANGCGDAQPNFGFTSALITQPPAMISHGKYMYIGPLGGTIVQFAVTIDPFSGFSNYTFRTYLTGLSLLTGLGVAEDLKSLMIFTDPTAVGLAAQEIVTRVPLCEDMLGELATTVPTGPTTPTTPVATGPTTTPPTTTIPTTPVSTTPTSTTPTTTTPTGTFVPTNPAATPTPTTTAGGGILLGGTGTASTGTAAASTPQAIGGTGGGIGSGTGGGAGAATPATGSTASNPAAGTPPKAAVANAGTGGAIPGPNSMLGISSSVGPAPNGPLAASATFVSQQGLPRIALDSPPPVNVNVAAGLDPNANVTVGSNGGSNRGNVTVSNSGNGNGKKRTATRRAGDKKKGNFAQGIARNGSSGG